MRADRMPEVEVGGIAPQVGEALSMVGIGRPVARHREVGVFGERLRTDQPRRRKHARRGGAEVPVAADIVFAFEALGIDPSLQKVFQSRQARRPGADDAPFTEHDE
jgi:hypothetical protein